MATKWIQPAPDDVKKLMLTLAVDRATQDDDQVPAILGMVVMRIRGSIAAAGVTPLSDNAAEVPPEAVMHTVVLTLAALVNATPNFQFLTKTEGVETGFGLAVRAAEDWIKKVQAGLPVSYPKDISEDEPRSLVRWGAETDIADMTT